MELHESLRERMRLLVAEYSGALAPARVITIAEGTAAALRRHRGTAGHDEALIADFLAEWHDSTRRRLIDEVAVELATARRAELPGAA
ncbi:hypothetical protein [Quadrisphaera setariae]|uniref:Uncharacterized protein n=1 Tax=Quadrisphaera setariae TaxID=2593304 RepID=A0A5C8Z387_9ACTN|nr:hypothetical protein [Quadrisphaera setariae]TXR51683.1 hypothetical protein FMM08_21905 [Quadrisphaera setariae]